MAAAIGTLLCLLCIVATVHASAAPKVDEFGGVTYTAGKSDGRGMHGHYPNASYFTARHFDYTVAFATTIGDRRVLLSSTRPVYADNCDTCFEIRFGGDDWCEIRKGGGDIGTLVQRARVPFKRSEAFWINVADGQITVGAGLAPWQYIFMVADANLKSDPLLNFGFSSAGQSIEYSGIVFTSSGSDPYEVVVPGNKRVYTRLSKRGPISIDNFEFHFQAMGFESLGIALLDATNAHVPVNHSKVPIELVIGSRHNRAAQIMYHGHEQLNTRGQYLLPIEYTHFWIKLTEDGDYEPAHANAPSRGLILSVGSGHRVGKYVIASVSIPRPRSSALQVAFAGDARPLAIREPRPASMQQRELSKAHARAAMLLQIRQHAAAARARVESHRRVAQLYSDRVKRRLIGSSAAGGFDKQ